MLEFDIKRLLFKAEIKRSKSKKRYGVTHLTLDRKQVFQQSFAEVMHRKPEELKSKFKI
jgi:hypothetical protein